MEKILPKIFTKTPDIVTGALYFLGRTIRTIQRKWPPVDIRWISSTEDPFRLLALYRSLLTSQILVGLYEHNCILFHPLHTHSMHIDELGVCVFWWI